MYRFICMVLVVLMLASDAFCQQLNVKVLVFEHGPEHQFAEINRNLSTSLQNALELRGIKPSESGIQLYAHASTFFAGADEYVAVTMIEGVTLSEDVITSASENEIWYAGQTDLPQTPEAKNVRQYMTREVLGHYVSIVDIKTFAVPKSQMESELDRFVDELVYRHSCEAFDSCVEK